MNAGAARVLALLRGASGAASGEALSAELGVSRAQVWKHIESLRRLGYDVEGEPGGGYRLRAAPDRLYGEEILCGLDTRWLAREIEHFEEIDSTNRVATERAAAGAAAGYTVVAEAQTAGRGRLGRHFFSPPHANLYTSIVLRPRLELAQAPTLIPTAAIAVADAIAAELGRRDDVEIKWPNDVWIAGRKVSGILLERVEGGDRALVGIGINLARVPLELPADVARRTTSLADVLGHVPSRTDVLGELLPRVDARLTDACEASQHGQLEDAWRSRLALRGQVVRFRQAGAPQAGVLEDASFVEGLLVRDESGPRWRPAAHVVDLSPA